MGRQPQDVGLQMTTVVRSMPDTTNYSSILGEQLGVADFCRVLRDWFD